MELDTIVTLDWGVFNPKNAIDLLFHPEISSKTTSFLLFGDLLSIFPPSQVLLHNPGLKIIIDILSVNEIMAYV